MIAHKAEIIRKAFRSNEATLARRLPDGRPDPAAALTCLGGFEIATMAGIVLGSASLGLPVLVDGFIASSAYACSARRLQITVLSPTPQPNLPTGQLWKGSLP